MEPDSNASYQNIMAIIDSGEFDSSIVLATIDEKIGVAKQRALSKKDILDKVEKWISACAEESRLEDYNRDDNRYGTSRGALINRKRAEKA